MTSWSARAKTSGVERLPGVITAWRTPAAARPPMSARAAMVFSRAVFTG
ncbi:hypothetical protein [Tepidiforma sp.]|nr:hypothetical protein [Tepidiforma sp.]